MVDDNDKDQKTEEPTSKRLSDAREKGNLSVSSELSTFAMVIAILIIFLWMLSPLGMAFVKTLRVFLEKPEQISIQDGGFQNILLGVISGIAMPASVVFVTFLIAAFLGTMLQTNFYIGTGKLKIDFAKLSPKAGFKKVFSMNAVTELIKSILKLIVLGYLAYIVIIGTFDVLPSLIENTLYNDILFLHGKVIHMLFYFLFVIAFLAVGDALYVHHQYITNLRMTKQEVKDEYKQMEGDPMIRSRLRQIRMEKAKKRMMSNVPNANVIIVNPTHYAVALKYDRDAMVAPVVTAKGVDHLAKRIREVADENEVPIVSNPTLARTLHDTVDLDDPIDPDHYRAVAEVISYVYKLKEGLSTD